MTSRTNSCFSSTRNASNSESSLAVALLMWENLHVSCEHRPPLSFGQFGQFFDDVCSAHTQKLIGQTSVVRMKFPTFSLTHLPTFPPTRRAGLLFHAFFLLHERDDLSQIIHHRFQFGDGFAGEVLRFGQFVA